MTSKLIFPYGETLISGILKQQPEDFRVVENLGFQLHGEGEHLFLNIEKINLTTTELIELVASDFAVKARDAGYSGLKDKHAITRQWISLYLPGEMQTRQIPQTSSYKILESGWHNKKLRPGSHRSNSFDVVIRQVESYPEAVREQVNQVKLQGFANYFGQQRFGQQQDNVDQALRAFSNPRKSRKLSRSKRSIYLSSLRSFLFNRILSYRISQNHWSLPVEGDVFMLSGSHSIFCSSIDETVIERYRAKDISSTASLYGTGLRKLEHLALSIEDDVLETYAEIKNCLLSLDLKLQMRATRESADRLSVDYDDRENFLRVKVTLPRGSYLTTLLEHFINLSE